MTAAAYGSRLKAGTTLNVPHTACPYPAKLPLSFSQLVMDGGQILDHPCA